MSQEYTLPKISLYAAIALRKGMTDLEIIQAACSEEKAFDAISDINRFLHLDLTAIRNSAETFLRDNDRLDIPWNNTRVMVPPQGSIIRQGFLMQLGTNNVAPFHFTKLLHPILAETARTAPVDSVRVVWVSSNGAELQSPKGGVSLNDIIPQR